ncbi:MAG TPA: FG-GAP-like repeat-containing protein, partial [Urbifossiella sp.]|nr:FG-GAP-like repeat-containing protein [Urbifossiella sp.]
DFLVVRFNPNGSLDTTFGTNGQVSVDINGGTDVAGGVAVDANNNVIVIGTSIVTGVGSDMAFARLLASNGALDTTLGGGTGIRTVSLSGNSTVTGTGVAVDAAGDIVGVGTSVLAPGDPSHVEVVRMLPSGQLDNTFNGAGFEAVLDAGSTDTGNGLALDHSGNILVTGFSSPTGGGQPQLAVARLLPNGNPDPAFNGGAVKKVNTGGTGDKGLAVAVDKTNNVYVAGDGEVGGDEETEVIKLTAGGALDPTFGVGGEFFDRAGGPGVSSFGTAIAVRPDGQVVVGGTAEVGTTAADFYALQVTPAGNLDTSFAATAPTPGVSLVAVTPGHFNDVNSNLTGGGMVVTPDGRIVLAGSDLTSGGVEAARLIGSVEKGLTLTAGGSTDGTAQVFTPPADASGKYPTTATATVGSFPGFGGDVRTAVADVNGDGIPDTILVTGPGTPLRMEVVSGADNKTLLVPSTAPFVGSEDFTGGGFVSAADIDADGRAEWAVTPDQGGGPRVTIFSLNPDGSVATRANFLGIDDPNFRGGARAALGDVNGDGVPDLAVAAGFLGGPRTALFDGKTLFTTPTRLVPDFFAFPGSDATTLRNGVFVSIGDVNGDGSGDLIFGGGPGGSPRVFILSGAMVSADNVAGAQAAPVANFFVAGNAADRGGVRVAATDADGDNKADLAVGSGEGDPADVRVYPGAAFSGSGEPSAFQDLKVFGGAVLPGGVYVGEPDEPRDPTRPPHPAARLGPEPHSFTSPIMPIPSRPRLAAEQLEARDVPAARPSPRFADTHPRRHRGRARTIVRLGVEELDERCLLSGAVPTDPVAFTPDTPFKLGNYWIDVPSSYDPSNQTPTTLFVWSHGAGGMSQFDIDDYKWTTGTPYIEIALDGREGGAWDVDADPAAVLAAIADVKTHYNIETTRVILGGYSSGGDLSYRVAFTNSEQIAGVLAENTTPFRDTGLTQDEALSAASFQFHVVQLAHTGDTTYPLATVQSETDAVKNAGFPLQLLTAPGHHFDNNTVSDYQTLVLPHISDGWTSPGIVGTPGGGAGPGTTAPQALAVSGQPDGSAPVFAAGTGGQYPTTPTTTLSPFGSIGSNVRTAVGDVDGDGIPDTILVTGPGTPIRVAVVSGADNTTVLVQPFDPFGGDFTGGGFVAAADLDGDGKAEFVVTPDQGGGPRVAIFKMSAGGSTATLANFFGIDDPNFRGGARAALGDVNGDGTPDLAVAAGFLGGPRTALFDGKTLLTTPTRLVSDFFAF